MTSVSKPGRDLCVGSCRNRRWGRADPYGLLDIALPAAYAKYDRDGAQQTKAN